MIDDRELLFPNPEARYEFDRDLVLFDGQVRGEAILCGISREALEDHFDRGKKGLVQMYKANYGRIHHEARRKYLSAQFESDGSVLIKTLDL